MTGLKLEDIGIPFKWDSAELITMLDLDLISNKFSKINDEGLSFR